MLKVAIERVVPLTEARGRLSEIVDGAVQDRFWVITRRGKPRVAVVDVQYLDELVRRAGFDAPAARTQEAFRQYLLRQGIDPDKVAEEEVEAMLH